MADVPDSKSGPRKGGVGSSPTFGTDTIAIRWYDFLQAFRADTSATTHALPRRLVLLGANASLDVR